MKNLRTGIGWSVLKGAVELLLGLPLLLITAAYTLPDDNSLGLWLTALLLSYAAGFAGGSLLSFKKRYQLLIFVMGIGALEAYLVFGTSYGFYLGMLIAALLTSRGVKFVNAAWHTVFPVSCFGIGLLLYFLSSVFMPFFPAFQPYLPWLLWCGLAALAISLLMTNQSMMKQETLSGDKEPVLAAAVIWQNRILVFIALAVIIIAVLFRKIQQAVLWLKEQLLAWLRELLSRTPDPPASNKTEQAPANLGGLGEGGQAAPWLIWLEKAFMVVMWAVLAALVLWLLYNVCRKLPKLLKVLYMKLLALLNRKELRKGPGGYEDDVESLMDWQALRDSMASRMKGWLPRKAQPRVKWDDLKDNRERVRYLYRSWIQKAVGNGYLPQRFLTAKETIQDIQSRDNKHRQPPDTLISLYEQVRYSDKAAAEKEVSRLKQSMDMKK
ncbi:MAG: hypothetical protein K0S39_5892 [Paenibacillus sp.]|jgi:hypothetical protein|nr:hypothetical protein [Paenibacillus sp.]